MMTNTNTQPITNMHPLKSGARVEYLFPAGCGCQGKFDVKINMIKESNFINNMYFYTMYNGDKIPQHQIQKIIC